MYIEYGIEDNNKNPKFKVGNHERIPKHKNIFAKGYLKNWSEEIFVITEIKHIVPQTSLVISTVKRLLEHSMKQICRRQVKNNSELKK